MKGQRLRRSFRIELEDDEHFGDDDRRDHPGLPTESLALAVVHVLEYFTHGHTTGQ